MLEEKMEIFNNLIVAILDTMDLETSEIFMKIFDEKLSGHEEE